jgi:hypothetical protein
MEGGVEEMKREAEREGLRVISVEMICQGLVR